MSRQLQKFSVVEGNQQLPFTRDEERIHTGNGKVIGVPCPYPSRLLLQDHEFTIISQSIIDLLEFRALKEILNSTACPHKR